MSTEQKREEIRRKVCEVIPEILELKFGCEIIVAGIANDNPGCERDVVLYGTWKQRQSGIIPTEYYGGVPMSEIEKTIGRPILAQDVLKTLKGFYCLDGEGRVWKYGKSTKYSFNEWVPTNLSINLSQNLSEWSPETIDKLYELFYE